MLKSSFVKPICAVSLSLALLLTACAPQTPTGSQRETVKNQTPIILPEVKPEPLASIKAFPGKYGIELEAKDPDHSLRKSLSDFRVKYFIERPDLQNNTAKGGEAWWFKAWFPDNSTTTITATITPTLPCQSTFLFPSTISYTFPDYHNETEFPDRIYHEFGFGPSSNTKDGPYNIQLKDEAGNTYTYTVYVNNGIPAVCPSPTPTPTPQPTATPKPGGGNPSPTPTPSPSPTATPSSSPSPTATPSASTTPSPSPSASPTPSMSPSPNPSTSPTPEPSEEPDEYSCENENNNGFSILDESNGGPRINYQQILQTTTSRVPVNGTFVKGLVDGRTFMAKLPTYSERVLKAMKADLQVYLRAIRSGTKPQSSQNYTQSDVDFAEALLSAVEAQISIAAQLCKEDSVAMLKDYYKHFDYSRTKPTNQKPDAHERELARLLSRLENNTEEVQTNVTFEGLGQGHNQEVDAISTHWVGEAKSAVPSNGELKTDLREQAIRNMVIAKQTGREVYFYFASSANPENNRKIVDQLSGYAYEIGVTGAVNIGGFQVTLNYTDL